MHVDYVNDYSKSVNPKVPKSQFDTLECTLEELAVLELIYKLSLIHILEVREVLPDMPEDWNEK